MAGFEAIPFDPGFLLPPMGSRWEEVGSGRWRLVRFEQKWREALRYRTAERSLEVGVGTWRFSTSGRYLGWVGRWASRRPEMRELEVCVDGQTVTRQWLDDCTAADCRLWLYHDLEAGEHQVQIYFPPTARLELSALLVDPGDRIAPLAPGIRWCSWGDSITQGTMCPSARQSYVQVAAEQLGWTAISRGFGGSGCPDPMTALAVASGEPWDILTIANAVNSAALGLDSPGEFERMYALCLDMLSERCPGRSIVCLGPILCTRASTDDGLPIGRRVDEFRRIIAGIASGRGAGHIYYVDGRELLGEENLLVDQVHPGLAGHAQMGARLAPLLARLCER